MNPKELYDHITKHMTPEQALLKLLEGHVLTYEKLKFNEGEETHPLFIISMAAMDMGWGMVIPHDCDEMEIQGMVVGTQEYINKTLGDDDEDLPNGWKENK